MLFSYNKKNQNHTVLTFSHLPNKYIISSLNLETQIKPRKKKKSYSGQIERRRKRRRTIGFGVEDDRFWGATIAIGDNESGFAIGDDESVLRLRSRSARRRSRRVKSNGDV